MCCYWLCNVGTATNCPGCRLRCRDTKSKARLRCPVGTGDPVMLHGSYGSRMRKRIMMIMIIWGGSKCEILNWVDRLTLLMRKGWPVINNYLQICLFGGKQLWKQQSIVSLCSCHRVPFMFVLHRTKTNPGCWCADLQGGGCFQPQSSTTHFEDERAACTAVVSSSCCCLKILSQPVFGGSYVWYDMEYFNPKILRCPRQSLLAMAYVPMSLDIFGGTKVWLFGCAVVESQLVTIY